MHINVLCLGVNVHFGKFPISRDDRGSAFGLAELRVAVAQVKSHVIIELIRATKANVPSEIRLVFTAGRQRHLIIRRTPAGLAAEESHADTGANIRREGRGVPEIVVDVGKQSLDTNFLLHGLVVDTIPIGIIGRTP